MIFMRILPGVLKELLKHVPTVLFEVVEWKVLMLELPKLSRRLMQKEGFEELFTKQCEYLKTFDIELITKKTHSTNLSPHQDFANKTLTLYFAQLFSPYGLFLDLSPNHLDMKNQKLTFQPNGLWTKFHTDFSQGLQKIYDGFFLDQEELFHEGLLACGLTSKNWSIEDRQALANLFKSHFGPSLTQEMTFDLETFKTSFFKIANFMLEKKVVISTDFLYLGIALVTLYSSLEKTKASVNVKEIYRSMRGQLDAH
jgi:hypothetical protein